MVVVLLSVYIVLAAAYLLWQLYEASVQAEFGVHAELIEESQTS